MAVTVKSVELLGKEGKGRVVAGVGVDALVGVEIKVEDDELVDFDVG